MPTVQLFFRTYFYFNSTIKQENPGTNDIIIHVGGFDTNIGGHLAVDGVGEDGGGGVDGVDY